MPGAVCITIRFVREAKPAISRIVIRAPGALIEGSITT